MEELYEYQLNDINNIMTEERYNKLKEYKDGKLLYYFNDDPINIGDVVLSGCIHTIISEGELKIDFIFLNKKHFELFDYDEKLNSRLKAKIPVIFYKNK